MTKHRIAPLGAAAASALTFVLTIALSLSLGLSLSLAWPSGAAAEPVCGKPHSVATGESLLSIAQVAFGDEDAWPRIYEYRGNAAWIGTDALSPPPGAILTLPPCDFRNVLFEDPLGAPPNTNPPKDAPKGAPKGAPPGPPIEILINDRADFFMSKSLPKFGLAYQITQAAFLASDLGANPRFFFIKDPESHIDALLRHRIFQIGAVWAKPDCAVEAQRAAAGGLCDYHFSAPIYETAIALYGRRDSATPPRTVYDLQGKRICRPKYEELYDLYEAGLTPGETVELIPGANATDCFEKLRDGAADFVFMDRFEAEVAANRENVSGHAVRLPQIIGARSLHLISTPMPDGSRHPWLDAFDQGLERLRENGLADAVISWHLARHRVILIR